MQTATTATITTCIRSLSRAHTRLPFSTTAATTTITTSSFSDHPLLSLLFNSHHNLCSSDLRPLLSLSTTSGLLHHPFPSSRLIQFFLHHRHLHLARVTFDSLPNPDTYTWNLMIMSHSLPLSLNFFSRMLLSASTFTSPPTSYTFSLLLNTFFLSTPSTTTYLSSFITLHAQLIKHGVIRSSLVILNSIITIYSNFGLPHHARLLFDSASHLDTISWNSIISGYSKNGLIHRARQLFDHMPHRNLVSWGAIIDGYVRTGGFVEALRLFNQMQVLRFRPDAVILVSVLKACANLGALHQGRWVHIFIEKNNVGRSSNVLLSTALVDMYAKCGCIEHALEVFNGVRGRDVVLWNAMIGGLAIHGYGREALEMFSSMKARGLSPNETTFINVLCACTHSRMVGEGREVFDSMKENGIEPRREHYGCLIDLLGRAGMVQEAEEVIKSMPMEPHASQWGALMAACRVHGNVEVAERVGKQLISLEPHDGGRYVQLSNVYASAGHWEDALEMRRVMEEKGAKKERGCSFVEFNGVVHEFYVGDKSHPQSREIYQILSEIEKRVKIVGYVQDTSQVLVEMCDQEEKEIALSYHSERLAIAFGIINLSHEIPIRIVKNLRVCRDCHNYTKLVSKVYQREIIVRDRHRFHRFKYGSCSCMDYW